MLSQNRGCAQRNLLISSFVRVLLKKKDDQGNIKDTNGNDIIYGYAIEKFSNANSVAYQGINTIQIRTFKKFANPGDTSSTVTDISYSSAKTDGYYATNVIIAHGQYNNAPNSYDDWERKAAVSDSNAISLDTYDGYAFVSNTADPVDGRTVTLRIADPSEYYVKIDCGTTPLTIPNNCDIYAKAILKGDKTAAKLRKNLNQ